jgi:hypothetical protein
LLLPNGWSEPPHFDSRMIIAAAGTVAFVFLTLRGPRRALKAVLGVAALAFFAAAIFRCRGDLAALAPGMNGDRYFFLPKLLIVWLVVQELADAERWRRCVGAAAVVVILGATTSAWRYERYTDLHWHHWADRIRAGEAVTVPVNPAGFTFHCPARPHQ